MLHKTAIGIFGIVTLIVSLSATIPPDNEPTAESVKLGEAVFKEQCRSCHKIEHKLVGPALGNIHKRRSYQWFANFTRNAPLMVSMGDKLANCIYHNYYMMVMPPQGINERQMQGLWDYIKTQSAALRVNVPDDAICESPE